MDRCSSSAGRLFAGVIVVTVALLAMIGCDGGTPTGEEIFNANCSACHGLGAVGTDVGPPLVHDFYHPGHHSDVSIRSAVRVGVKQHHWFFGDMPPVAGVSPGDVEKIVCYIRETQRSNGIFEGDAFNTVC